MNTKIFDPKKEIINTLSYKKIFGQPLRFYQIIYFSHTKFYYLSEIEGYLQELIEKHKIKYNNGFYFLGTHKTKKDEIKEIQQKFSIAKTTFEKLESIKFIFESIPFIKFVGVTGTLASYNFDFEKDDIDLFFICSKNRLWITRLFLVIILKILNLYVSNQNPKLKICPNLYLSEDNLTWNLKKQNLYVAHEIAMLHPLVDKDNTYFKFINNNKWVQDFIPNFEINFEIDNFQPRKEISILDIVELILMNIQVFFMKVRFGSEVLNKDIIHFVKVDHSINIMSNYEKIKS